MVVVSYEWYKTTYGGELDEDTFNRLASQAVSYTHLVKSSKAQRFRARRKVRKYIDRIVGLTGTPAPNGLLDLWSQVYLLDEGARLGRTLSAYRDTYFTPGRRGPNGIVYDWNRCV